MIFAKTRLSRWIAGVAVVFSFVIPSIAATQPGLTLGGKFIPKEHIFVFLLVGNSALTGRAPTPDVTVDPRAFKYILTNTTNCPNPCPPLNSWQPAVDPLCYDVNNGGSSPKSGPGDPLVKRLAVDPGMNCNYIGALQLSGSGWVLSDHFSSATTGDFKTMVTQAKALMPNVTIAGLISMFNLVEVQNWLGTPSQVNNYLTSVITMVKGFRTSLGIDTLPYIHSGYPVLAGGDYALTGGKNSAGAQKIVQLIAKIPDSITRSTVLPTDGITILTSDGYSSHYDHNGNVGWGNRTADTVLAMIKRHWIPAAATFCQATLNGDVKANHSSAVSPIRTLFFNGADYSVFSKINQAGSVYLANGKFVGIAGRIMQEKRGLIQGIYLVRQEKRN
jgi:hypothetical protein